MRIHVVTGTCQVTEEGSTDYVVTEAAEVVTQISTIDRAECLAQQIDNCALLYFDHLIRSVIRCILSLYITLHSEK